MPAELPGQFLLLCVLACLLLDLVRGTKMKSLCRVLFVLLAVLLILGLPLAVVWGQEPAGRFRPHLSQGSTAADGTVAQIDWPTALWRKNEGGSDGAGLCVFRSASNSSIWHRADVEGLFDWMRRHPGGGYPEKFAKMLAQFCRETGRREPAYLQVQVGRDFPLPKVLDLLAAAVANGHCPAITYSYSPSGRYGGRKIAHMVNLVAARAGKERLWATMDNNYDSRREWMTEQQFARTFAGDGYGWAIIFLRPGPVPVPKN